MADEELRVLLADDVPAVLTGMSSIVRRIVPTAQVHLATNGEQALSIARDLRPQVVVTDIRMPVMDGLTLCQRIRELDMDPALVIMSGYEDFDYAKKAIDLGVKKYMLKPVDPVFFAGILSEIVDDLRATQEKAERQEGSYRLARQRLLLKLTSAPEQQAEKLVSAAAESGIGLLGDRSQLILVHLDSMNSLETDTAEQFHIALTGYLDPSFDFVWEEMARGQFLALVNLGAQAHLPPPEALRGRLPACWQGVRVGISRAFSGSRGFSDALQCARAMANHALFCGGTLGASPETAAMERGERALWAQVERQQFIDIARQIGMCFDQQLHALSQRYLRILIELFEGRALEAEALRAAAVTFSCLMNECAFARFDQGIAALYRGELNLCHLKDEIVDLGDLKGYCAQLIDRIQSRLAMGGESAGNFLASRAIQAIHADLAGASLDSVAWQLGISGVYLSMLFKEQTGTKFKDYLTNARIEAAKALLSQPGSKINEITAQLGYADTKHFCKLFKRYTGQSPSAYKASGAP